MFWVQRQCHCLTDQFGLAHNRRPSIQNQSDGAAPEKPFRLIGFVRFLARCLFTAAHSRATSAGQLCTSTRKIKILRSLDPQPCAAVEPGLMDESTTFCECVRHRDSGFALFPRLPRTLIFGVATGGNWCWPLLLAVDLVRRIYDSGPGLEVISLDTAVQKLDRFWSLRMHAVSQKEINLVQAIITSSLVSGQVLFFYL